MTHCRLKLWRLLSHLTIIFALCFLVFLILDWYNPMMAFVTNGISTKLLAIFCIVSILSSLRSLFTEAKHSTENAQHNPVTRRHP